MDEVEGVGEHPFGRLGGDEDNPGAADVFEEDEDAVGTADVDGVGALCAFDGDGAGAAGAFDDGGGDEDGTPLGAGTAGAFEGDGASDFDRDDSGAFCFFKSAWYPWPVTYPSAQALAVAARTVQSDLSEWRSFHCVLGGAALVVAAVTLLPAPEARIRTQEPLLLTGAEGIVVFNVVRRR